MRPSALLKAHKAKLAGMSVTAGTEQMYSVMSHVLECLPMTIVCESGALPALAAYSSRRFRPGADDLGVCDFSLFAKVLSQPVLVNIRWQVLDAQPRRCRVLSHVCQSCSGACFTWVC